MEPVDLSQDRTTFEVLDMTNIAGLDRDVALETLPKLYRVGKTDNPHRCHAFIQAGRIEAQFKGDNIAAERAFRAAVAVDDQSAEAHAALGQHLYRTHSMIADAETSMKNAVFLDDSVSSYKVTLAQILIRHRHKVDVGAKLLEEILVRDRGNLEAMLELAIVERDHRLRPRRAYDLFTQALKIAPNATLENDAGACVDLFDGDSEVAKAHFERAAEYGPRNGLRVYVSALTNLAAVYETHDLEYERAQELLEKAIDADPTAWQPHTRLGTLKLQQHDYMAAEQHLRAAVDKSDGRDSMARVNLAMLLMRRYRRQEEAEDHFRAAVLRDPSLAVYEVNIFGSKDTTGKFEEGGGGQTRSF